MNWTSLLTLVFASIFSAGSNSPVVGEPTASPTPSPSVVVAASQENAPELVLNAVRQKISNDRGIPTSDLNIVESRRETWPDGCLGLAGSDEMCTLALVEGWRVVVEHHEHRWVYRTNSDGRVIRQENSHHGVEIPNSVKEAVLEQASQQSSVPREELMIVQAEQRTWSDGCLGLGGPAELCLAALTEGWRVEVSHEDHTWVYRTNEDGSAVRQETSEHGMEIPQSVEDTVLEQASQESGIPRDELSIIHSEQQTWPNGCLGLAEPDEMCTEALVEGWRVTVTNNSQNWIYRTDSTGNNVRLEVGEDSVITFPDSVSPEAIPVSELPSPLPNNVILRARASGGLTGRTQETLLMGNGRIHHRLITVDGRTISEQNYQISAEQVQQFEQLLAQEDLSRWDGVSFPFPNGSADVITVTLTSRAGTTRYPDFAHNQLPESFRNVVQSWNELFQNAAR